MRPVPRSSWWAVAAAAAATAWAEPPAQKPKRHPPVAVVGVPADVGATELAARVEQALIKAVAGDARVRTIDVAAHFSPEPSAALAKAEQILVQARAEYDNLDLDAATNDATQAVKLLVSAPAEVEANRLGYALCLLGSAQFLNGQEQKAAESYRRGAQMAPRYKPDPKAFAPDQIDRYNRAVAEVASGPKGSIAVQSPGGPAEVLIDGSVVGTTPVTAKDLPIGRHPVVVRRPGYAPFGTFENVEAQEAPTTVEARLEPLPAMARFQRETERAAKDADQGLTSDSAAAAAAEADAEYLLLAYVREKDGKALVRLFVVDGVRRGIRYEASRSISSSAADFEQTVEGWAPELVGAVFVPASKPSPIITEAMALKSQIPWKWVGAGAGVVAVGIVLAVVLIPRSHGNPIVTGVP